MPKPKQACKSLLRAIRQMETDAGALRRGVTELCNRGAGQAGAAEAWSKATREDMGTIGQKLDEVLPAYSPIPERIQSSAERQAHEVSAASAVAVEGVHAVGDSVLDGRQRICREISAVGGTVVRWQRERGDEEDTRKDAAADLLRSRRGEVERNQAISALSRQLDDLFRERRTVQLAVSAQHQGEMALSRLTEMVCAAGRGNDLGDWKEAIAVARDACPDGALAEELSQLLEKEAVAVSDVANTVHPHTAGCSSSGEALLRWNAGEFSCLIDELVRLQRQSPHPAVVALSDAFGVAHDV